MAILNDNEFTEVEGRSYVNPQVALDESNTFIDNLRSTQQANNQQIQTDAYNLGTEIPSDLGGLTGGEGYFAARYQTPQTASAVSSLRAAAQATALNQVLADEQAKWKKRYNDAYRAYQKREHDSGKNTNSSTDATGDVSQSNTTLEIGDVSTEALANSRYQKLLMKYIQAGYPTDVAEEMAKEDFGKSVSTDATVSQYPYTRTKATVGSGNSYIYTLPNGHTVLVDEDKYELIQPDYGGYALKDKQTGELRQVGG